MIPRHEHVVDRLNAYLDGLLGQGDSADVKRHCNHCAFCQAALERLGAERWGDPWQTGGAITKATRRPSRPHRGWPGLWSFFWLTLIAVAVVLTVCHVHFKTLTPSPYDLRVLGQTEWLSGTQAAIHLQVARHDGRQEPGIPVSVELTDPNPAAGRRVQLASMTTGGHGWPSRASGCPTGPMGNINCTSRPRRAGLPTQRRSHGP
jgi:hypothetical protein